MSKLPPRHCAEHARRTQGCAGCRQAEARHMRHYRKLRTMGRKPIVDAQGTRRRVQALMAIGYSTEVLASRIGCKRQNVHRLIDEPSVRAQTAKQVELVYDELSGVIPPENRHVKRVRTLAKRRGFAPPLAWDDIDYDHAPYDPDADDKIDEADEYARLRYLGLMDWEIAQRLGINERSLQRRLGRAA